MAKNLISVPILARLVKIWVPKTFFMSLTSVRHCRRLSSYSISRKAYNPNTKKWRKTTFWDWFRPVRPKFGRLKLVVKLLVRHCFKLSLYAIKEKLMNQTWKNVEKPNLGRDFGPSGPNLGTKIFFRGVYLY